MNLLLCLIIGNMVTYVIIIKANVVTEVRFQLQNVFFSRLNTDEINFKIVAIIIITTLWF